MSEDLILDEIRSLKEEMQFSNKAAFNPTEAAKYTGIGVKSLKEAATRGELHHKKIGRNWIFPKASLDEWLASEDSEVAEVVYLAR